VLDALRAPVAATLNGIMSLALFGNKKSSLILSGLFLLSFLALAITEKSLSPSYIFILASIIFLVAGLKLSNRQNQFLLAFMLSLVVVAAIYLFVTSPEGT